MKNYTVNESGLSFIREILESRQKGFGDLLPDEQDQSVSAYAREVEDDYELNESGSFEVAGLHSVSGNPETFGLTADQFDMEYIDDCAGSTAEKAAFKQE